MPRVGEPLQSRGRALGLHDPGFDQSVTDLGQTDLLRVQAVGDVPAGFDQLHQLSHVDLLDAGQPLLM